MGQNQTQIQGQDQNQSQGRSPRSQVIQFTVFKSLNRQRGILDTYQSSDGRAPSKRIPESESQVKLQIDQINIQTSYEYELDLRQPAKSNGNQYEYPFRSIGYITSIFYLGKQRYNIQCGTGFLIQKNVVLTCAHNIYNRSLKRKADQVIFIPALNGNRGCQILIKDNYLRFPQEFICEKEQYKKFDYAILYLGQIDLSQTHGYLGFETKKNNLQQKVLLFGYPQDKQKEIPNQYQFGMSGVVKKQDQNFLYYHICTNAGQSGSPIIKCCKKGVCRTVGIHMYKDKQEKFNVGLRFNEHIRNQINEWIIDIQKQTKKQQKAMSGFIKNESQIWDQIQRLKISKDDIQQFEKKFKKKALSDDIINILLKQTKIQFKKLRELNLSELGLTRKGLISISSCQSKFKNIQYLYLHNNQISNKGVEYLTRNQNIFKNIRQLGLSNNQIGNEGIGYLTRNQNVFKNLERLWLSNNQIGNEGIEHLTRNQNVFKNLERLWLSNNLIGNEGIAHLTRNQNAFKNLEYLYLHNNQIGNEGIEHLTRNQNVFKNLRQLGLNNNQIGNEGIEYLTRNQNVFKNLGWLYLNGNRFEQNNEREHKQLLRNHYKKLYSVQIRSRQFDYD